MQTISLPFFSFKENGRRHLWSFKYKRQILKLSDGGQIALDWAVPKCPELESKISNNKTPLLVVVPGLTGHNDDLYMVSTALEAVNKEYQLVLVNHRG